MKKTNKTSRFAGMWNRFLTKLQDPKVLEITVFAVIGIFGLGAGGIYSLGRIGQLEEEIAVQKKRQEIIRAADFAKSRLKSYLKTFPKNGDLNWWIAYILSGSRKVGLKVVEYKPRKPHGNIAKIGQYQGMILKFSTSGTVKNILDFLRWLEYNKYSVRVIHLRIQKELGTTAILGDFTVAVITSKSQIKSAAG